MKIVIINGKAGCGKDTFVSMCRDILGENLVCNISTVDFVKEVATFCGWNGEKTPENRKFLSDLEDLLTKWGNLPVKKVMNAVDEYNNYLLDLELYDTGVVFIHCREPEEISRLVSEFCGDATTLLIRRTSSELVEQINHADNNVLNYDYDYTIWNDSNLSVLRYNAMIFLRECLGFNV
jgi:guanylate kinase